MALVEQFTIPYSSLAVEDLRDRLRRTRWPDEIANADWAYGFNREFLVDLCAYWSDGFDWQAQVERLSAFEHFRFQPGGGREGHEGEGHFGKVHFIHAKGKGPHPMPIILTHGWPGSFAEMLAILPLLTDPAAHGFDAADSFDVVVPSLPGFGFSDRPGKPGMNAHRVADLWVELMGALGYDRFAAQGGDLGAGVSTSLGLRHSQHMIGIHLNFIPGSYRPYVGAGQTLTDEEQEYAARAARWFDQNGAYAHLQGTRPQTPVYALNDSPAGLAAWILEKFREWSDCGGDVLSRFSRDELLTNVTLYWMTETISSSFRMYYEGRRAPLHFAEGEFVHVPCAMAAFPREIGFPPRRWVERGYNVQRWTEMLRGGHFAAAEEPGLLAADIRTFFRELRP